MKKNNHVIQQYLKEVSAELSCPRSVKAVYKSELRNDILNCFSNKDSVSIEEIYDKFGTPESIADGFLDKNDYKRLLKKAKKRSAVWMIVSILAVIFVIVVIAVFAYIIHELTGGTVSISKPYYT